MMIYRILAISLVCLGLVACASSGGQKNKASLKRAAGFNVQLGLGYLNQGELSLAKKKLDKAHKQDSDLPQLYAAYAMLNWRLGQHKEADKNFKKALRDDPYNSEFLNNYGSFLCERDRKGEAEQKFLAALKDPLYATPEFAYTNAGTCALEVPDYNKAESYLRKALMGNPKFAPALFQMALLSSKRQQTKLGIAYLERYHKVAKQTPDSLRLGIDLSEAIGDKESLDYYKWVLKNKFPNS